MTFDPYVQDYQDGPLTEAFVRRVRTAKDALGLSFKDVAQSWGISPAWAERILAQSRERREDAKPSTGTTLKFVAVLNEWEKYAQRSDRRPGEDRPADAATHIAALNALGFEVSLRPLRQG